MDDQNFNQFNNEIKPEGNELAAGTDQNIKPQEMKPNTGRQETPIYDPHRERPELGGRDSRYSSSYSSRMPEDNLKDDGKNKSGRALFIIAAVLVVIAVAFVSILGTLAFSNIFKKNEPTARKEISLTPEITSSQAEETKAEVEEAELAASETKRDVLDIDTVSPDRNQSSGLLQDAAEKVIPSVVLVREYRSNDSVFQFGQGGKELVYGEGSGVILSKEGYIVTNAHVVSGGDKLEVVIYNGTSFEAELMGVDGVTDLAVLKIDPAEQELIPATFASSSGLRVADQVIAVGNPTGSVLSSTVTVGYISALNRMIMADDGSNMNYIQTDAAINSGNSGGALANLNGEVIGINSLKVSGEAFEGLGFAIPWDMAEPVVKDLAEYGSVQNRPALGVRGNYIDSRSALYYNLPSTGFYVAEVVNEDLLQAGLNEGSIIISVDGIELVSASTLVNYLAQKRPGDIVEFEIIDSSSQERSKIKVKLIDNKAMQ